MIFKWFKDNLRLAVGIGLFVGLIALILTVKACGTDERAQAKQDTKAADAYAGAAKEAIETVTERASKEASVDAIVAAATLEIDNAENPVAARAAVIASLCGMSAYRSRPECALRGNDPANVE